MAQYPFPNPSNTPPPRPNAPLAESTPRGQSIAQRVVHGFGFVLLIVGLWVALAVLLEAWSLYRSPVGIERFAQAIEQGSRIDQSLARAGQDKTEPDEAAPSGAPPKAQVGDSVLGFRLSYFIAWVIAILLLMLIGRLAIAAVKTGGELVLYDRHVLKLAQEIVRESTRTR